MSLTARQRHAIIRTVNLLKYEIKKLNVLIKEKQQSLDKYEKMLKEEGNN